MAQYILRDLPVDLWKNVHARAEEENWSLRALILQLLEDYAEHRIAPSKGPPPGLVVRKP